jgi:hypothetical protein
MEIIPKDFNFYCEDKLILSLSGFSENLSKLPIGYSENYKTESIFGLLTSVAKNPKCSLGILESVGKLIKICVQKYRPYKILVNAEQEDLAYFLNYVAKEFNEENTVQLQEGILDFCVVNDEGAETEAEILWRQMEKRLTEMEKFAEEELCQIINELSGLEKLAIKLFADTQDIELKNKINAAKEMALNFLYYNRRQNV